MFSLVAEYIIMLFLIKLLMFRWIMLARFIGMGFILAGIGV